jgi:hypothetical protein
MAHQVFICHSSSDAGPASVACAHLENAGVTCWIAPRDPVPGLPYGQQIVHAIAECTIVLFLLSAHSNDSRACLGEVELAANRNKILLPLRIAAVAPSESLEYYIRSVHWQDALAPPFEAHLDELVARVRELLGASHERPASVPVPATPAIPAADLAAVTAQLAAYIGPMARVLVARYAPLAPNIAALYDALGEEIPDPAERSRFRAATPH